MHKTAEVLAQLGKEKARLEGELAGVQRAIDALEEALGGEDLSDEPVAAAPAAPPPPISAIGPEAPEPAGPYSGMGFYEAVALYLAEAAEPKTSREIVAALLAGGYRTDAANFHASARAMLRRSFSTGPFGIHMNEDATLWSVHVRDPDATA